ncbi:MAG: YihY/virulence factor BrkB family protein [Acidimicrobiales bacterium]|nr:YihY/virulence factor BrkB family protein [Acidimicrobiales bacterium]
MTDAASSSYLRDEGRNRGRGATTPLQVPPRGWKDVAVRVKEQFKLDAVPLLAAGVAFFALLALVPALVALVSVYGLVADPADIERNIDDALSAAPTEVRELVSSQLSSIVESEPSGLQLGVVVGLVVALWSASSGMKHLMGAINLAYDETEGRGFLRLRGMALALTVGAIVVAAVAVAGLLVLPNALDSSGAEGALRIVLLVVRWPLLAVVALAALAALYRWAPDREHARWQWVSVGALVATVVWLVASVAFSIYTANFGSYNETYGALGAVVVVMLWLFISAYAVIAGAEVNAELERQTARDTTTGSAQPLGERDAYAADTVGPSTAKKRS